MRGDAIYLCKLAILRIPPRVRHQRGSDLRALEFWPVTGEARSLSMEDRSAQLDSRRSDIAGVRRCRLLMPRERGGGRQHQHRRSNGYRPDRITHRLESTA